MPHRLAHPLVYRVMCPCLSPLLLAPSPPPSPPGEDAPLVVEVLAAYQEVTCAGQRRGYASVRRYYRPQVSQGGPQRGVGWRAAWGRGQV
jgi:hypothetical protein